MQYTPNFNFSIAEGTDTVNLLTQCYPNFTNLDTILEAIKATGITKAVHTKVGTVHELVRADADCEVIRFVATSNFSVNDTFTVDGVAVTATAMDGSALPAGAFVINQSVEVIINGLVLTVVGVQEHVNPIAANVSYDNSGSGLAASNVQDAIDEVNAKTIPQHVSVTADGVKTYSQLLDDLYALVDQTKVTGKSYIEFEGSIVAQQQAGRFQRMLMKGSGTAVDVIDIVFIANGSIVRLGQFSAGAMSNADSSTTVPTSGIKYRFYY